MPEGKSLKRQHLQQFLMAARRQEAGQADTGCPDIVSGPRIGPRRAQQANEPIRPEGGSLRGAAQFAPPASDQGEVLDAILLDCLPEPVQPFVAGLSVSGSPDHN